MRSLLRKCSSFLHIPAREKLWFCWLWLLSGMIRAAVLLLPFRKLAPMLGEHCSNLQLATLASEEQKQLAWRIGRMVDLAASYTPWESKCLVQACAASLLLRHYDIPYVIHLGVSRGGEVGDVLKAHAWLAVGPWIIAGRDGHRAFTIVSTFVSPELLTTSDGASRAS